MIPLPTIESYASQFARTPVTISCDAPATFPAKTSGFVAILNGRIVATIHLPAPTCSRLEHLDNGNSIIPADMLVLTHESEHIALDSTDECQVQAAAVANEWTMLKLFRLAAWRVKAILAGAAYVNAHFPAEYHPDALTGAC